MPAATSAAFSPNARRPTRPTAGTSSAPTTACAHLTAASEPKAASIVPRK